MLFRAIRLLGPGEPPVFDVLRTTWPTAAEPSSFAPPIEAHEDEDAFTVSFHVGGLEPARLLVEVVERTLFLVEGRVRPDPEGRRRRGRVRVFALGAAVESHSLESRIAGDVLTVRIVKASSVERRSIVLRSKP